MKPGPLVVIRDNQLIEQPNVTLRHFRTQLSSRIKQAHLDPDTHDTVWAYALTANDWPDLPPWVQQLLRPQ